MGLGQSPAQGVQLLGGLIVQRPGIELRFRELDWQVVECQMRGVPPGSWRRRSLGLQDSLLCGSWGFGQSPTVLGTGTF